MLNETINPSFVLTSISVLAHMVASMGLFLMLLNRKLILLPDSPYKITLIGAVGALFMLVAAGIGYGASFSIGIFTIPAVVLSGLSLGELRRAYLRRQFRGSPPVSKKSGKISLYRPITTDDLDILRYTVTAPRWSGEQLTVAHLSDLHINKNLPYEYYCNTIEQVNALDPDLVFITGDFVSERAYIAQISKVLSHLDDPSKAFAVLGNHDYWVNASEIASAIENSGVTLLHNEQQRLQRTAKDNILICGCEDPWGSGTWQPPHGEDKDLLLMLTHTADNIYRLSRADVSAAFAGHYHAGQVQIPGLGPLIVPSVYGRRFDHGHFLVDKTHLFVSAGVGASLPSFRFYCRPDIFVVDFEGNRSLTGASR